VRQPAYKLGAMNRRLAALSVVVIAVLAGATTSAAAHIKTFTYRNLSPYSEEVAAAAKAWSTAGLALRIVPARPGQRADITVAAHDFGKRSPVLGRAAGPKLLLRAGIRPEGGEPLQRIMGFVATHEFGHEIGLRHTRLDVCSIMIPDGETSAELPCHESAGYAACGPQRVNIRTAAQIWGWAAGGRRVIAQPGFGRCLISRGPTGANPTSQDCPATVPLVDGDEAVLGHFYGAQVRFPYQSECDYTTRSGRETWHLEIETWTIDGYFLTDKYKPASGDCTGKHPDSPHEVSSQTRFLTARVIYPEKAASPQAGFETVLNSVVRAAEAAGVGLVCTAPQG
jgi:hypothetical protein